MPPSYEAFSVLREISWNQVDFFTTAGARGGQRGSEEGCFKCSSNGALVFKGRPDVRAVFFATPSMRTGLLLRSLRKNSCRLSTLASDVSLPSSNEQREWL